MFRSWVGRFSERLTDRINNSFEGDKVLRKSRFAASEAIVLIPLLFSLISTVWLGGHDSVTVNDSDNACVILQIRTTI